MKVYCIVAGAAVAVLNGLVFVPELGYYSQYLITAAIAMGLWLALKGFMHKEADAAAEAANATSAKAESVVPPAPLAVAPVETKAPAEAEVVSLLGVFQEKGRLIDFLMDDIAAYGDAQVGAAARVVHQGCKSVLAEHFEISPVSTAKEGSSVTVPTDAPSGFYSLSGKVSGEGPYTGKLVHKGWKADKVKLPRIVNLDKNSLPAIAPAQVEVK